MSRRALAFAVFALVHGAAGCTPAPAGSPQAPGRDFTASQIDGRTFALHAHVGEVVVLAFFATWSKPSTVELRHLQELYDQRRADGLLVVGIAVDGPETVAQVPAFAKRNGITFPLVLDEDSHVVALFDPKRDVPLTVLVDRTGAAVRTWSGYNPGDETLVAAAVDEALRAPHPSM